MSMFKYQNLSFIGRILVLAGIILASAKWFFDLDEIGSWTLLFLIPGLFLTYYGEQKMKSGNDA